MENKVEYIGHYGGDLTHSLSAWTSTSRDLTEEKRERIPKLLKMLAKAGHHTPFEKSTLHFLVTTDIASHIHMLKHRIAVPLNGESARYKELKEDKNYQPEDWTDIKVEEDTVFWHVHADKMYADSTYYNDNRSDLTWLETLQEFQNKADYLYHKALEELTPILGRKRAKESARYFKTYGSQITADVAFNWRSFMHFQGLRNKPDAQLEIQKIAQDMLKIVHNIEGNPFEHSLKAFGYAPETGV